MENLKRREQAGSVFIFLLRHPRNTCSHSLEQKSIKIRADNLRQAELLAENQKSDLLCEECDSFYKLER